jgi:hypothetical protein
MITKIGLMAQDWEMEVTIDLFTATCLQERLTSVSYSYDDKNEADGFNNDVSGTLTFTPPGTSSRATFRVIGNSHLGYSPTGTFSISVSGTCGRWEATDYGALSASRTLNIPVGTHNYPEEGDCQSYYYPQGALSDGQSDLSIQINYYPRLAAGIPVERDCKDVSFSYTGCLLGTLSWEVTDPSTRTVKNIGALTTYSMTTIASHFGNRYGTYEIRATDGGKRKSKPQGFTIDAPAPTATFSKKDVTCHGGSDGEISLNITSSAGIDRFIIYAYKSPDEEDPWAQIDNANTSPIITSAHANGDGIPAQTYHVRIMNNPTDANLGRCDILHRDIVTIAQPTAVTITSLDTIRARCFGESSGQISATVQGGTPPYRYEWSHNKSLNSNIATGLPKGSYTVYVWDSKNCPGPTGAHKTIEVKEPSELKASIIKDPDARSFDVTCWYLSDGEARAATSGGNGGYSYVWSSGEITAGINNKPPGMYTVNVTDKKGCSSSATEELKAPPKIDFTIDQMSTLVCPDDVTSLQADLNITTVQGQPHYLWSTGETTDAVENKAGGETYSLTISDDQGCSSTESINVVRPEPFVVSLNILSNYNGAPIQCDNDANGQLGSTVRDMSVQPPANNEVSAQHYAWYKNGSLFHQGAALSTISGLEEGNYRLQIQYRGRCYAESTIFLNDPEPIIPEIVIRSNYHGSAISCHGESDARLEVLASGGTNEPNYSYTWSSGEVSRVITEKASGTYTVTVTDVNGCTGTDEIEVEDPEPVEALITDFSNYNSFGESCRGKKDGSITALGQGGTGTFTYVWSNGQTSATAVKLGEGTFTVTVSDRNGCTATNAKTLLSPPPLLLAVNEIRQPLCNGSADGWISLTPAGGAGSYEFAVGGPASWSPNALFNNLRAQRHTFYLKDANGCLATTETILGEPEPLEISFTSIEPAYCSDARGKVTSLASGGTGTYKYTWTDSQNNVISLSSDVSNLRAGIYKILVEDQHQCLFDSSVAITSTDGAKTLHESVSVKCSYAADGSAEVKIISGSGPFRFEWPEGQTSSQVSGLKKGLYNVLITDVNECTVVEPVTVGGPDELTLLSAYQLPSCNGVCDGQITLSASGGTAPYRFLWNNKESAQQNNLCAGEYVVSVKDVNDCELVQEVSLNQPDKLTVTVADRTLATCENGCDGSLKIEASGGNGGYTYLWDNGKVTATNSNICPGRHTVAVTDLKACKVEATLELKNTPPLDPGLEDGATICVGQVYRLDAGSHWVEQSWERNGVMLTTTPVLSVTEPGEYILKVLNDNGCMGKDTFLLETSLSLLKASFLTPAEAQVFDTVAFIDISWPIPDRSEWQFPSAMTQIASTEHSVQGQFAKAGEYAIGIKAYLGECRDAVTKTITIIDETVSPEGGRLGHEDYLKKFELHPIPNDGSFSVEIALASEGNITLSVWNVARSLLIAKYHAEGSDTYNRSFDLRPLSPGVYVLRVDHANGSSYKRFVVR